MEIVIRDHFLSLPKEDYSDYEPDECISILFEVCKQIDELKIASFTVDFSDSDDRFANTDFTYDFLSIATELELVIKLAKARESFFLHFYELDRNVCFSNSEDTFNVEIYNSIKSELVYKSEVDCFLFEDKLNQLLDDFKFIIVKYFPIAFAIFKKQRYMFG